MQKSKLELEFKKVAHQWLADKGEVMGRDDVVEYWLSKFDSLKAELVGKIDKIHAKSFDSGEIIYELIKLIKEL